jgi:hypothetical protein
MTPATDWKEVVTPGEEERFERYAKELRAIQHRRANGSPASRALHAKANLGVEAELTVLPDLPEHAAMGLFATPATYRAYVRYSNGAGKRQPDEVPDVRGMAIKVVGVGGQKIIPGMQDAKTQDFLAIRTPSTPFRNADEFVKLVLAAENPLLLPIRVLLDNGLSRGLALLKALMGALKVAMTPLAATRYYSALPIKYGPYAVHYALFPHASPYELPPPSPEYLADELAARLRREPVVYDLRVQFFKDEQATPIEDGSVEWREQDAPFVTVAKLTLPKQDVASPRGRKIAELIEKLSFDPWHAREDHQPLGNMMRARNHAYRESTQERGAAPEPDGTETFD